MGRPIRDTRCFRLLSRPAAALALVAASASIAAAASAQSPAGVSAGTDDAKVPELVKTVPISKKHSQKSRSVLSLAPSELGPLERGDTVRGMADVEVSVTCTEPSPQCVGTIYGYSPSVRAKFVLARSPSATRGIPVGDPQRISCSQDYPNRNHHCVLVIDESARMGKACAACRLNLVMTAWHPKARPGNVIVVGADSDDGIKQGKAHISAVVFDGPAKAAEADRFRSTTPLLRRAPVVRQNDDLILKPLAVVRVDHLEAGDVLVFSAKAETGIGHLDYNVLHQAQILVSAERNSIVGGLLAAIAVVKNGLITSRNGSNCTQGPSGFSNPCPLKRVGAIVMERPAVENPNSEKNPGADVPMYFTLVAAFAAQYGAPAKPGDRVEIRKVDLVVERYPAG